jgi:hypothetical protein
MTDLERLQECIVASGKSKRAFAADLGVSASYLYDVLSGNRPVGDKIKGYVNGRRPDPGSTEDKA